MPRCTHIHMLAANCPRLCTRENVPGRQRAVLSKQLQYQQPDMGVRLGSHNTSVTSKLLWKNLRKYTFLYFTNTKGEIFWPGCLITAYSVMLCSTDFLVMFQHNHSCETLLKNVTKRDRKRQTKSERWQIKAQSCGGSVLCTGVWLTLPRGYKLPLEENWIPTQACGIQPGTLSVSRFDTAVWVPNASQTGT